MLKINRGNCTSLPISETPVGVTAGWFGEPDPFDRFQDGLDGTIRLEDTIYAKSYKTVDARGHQLLCRAFDES